MFRRVVRGTKCLSLVIIPMPLHYCDMMDSENCSGVFHTACILPAIWVPGGGRVGREECTPLSYMCMCN